MGAAHLADEVSALVVGDAMIDITVQLSGELVVGSDTPGQVSSQPGGSAANTACWLATEGVAVGFYGFVGSDLAAESFRHSLTNAGVTPELQAVEDATTGSCVCLIDHDGERTMVPDSGANSKLSASQLSLPLLRSFRHLHLSAYPLLREQTSRETVEILDMARREGLTVSVDPASSGPIATFGAERLLQLMGEIEILFPDEQEALALTGQTDPSDAARTLLQFAKVVVIKLGGRGALALSRETPDAPVVEENFKGQASVLDTTGAGDAFAAGFLSRWLRGDELSTCLAGGVQLAQVCVQQIGGRPKI